MALIWALILLLSYLCELGKLWARTSYLTSLCLGVLSVKQEQWHLVELGWNPLSQLLCVRPRRRTARLKGRRALLLLDASLVSSTCLPSPCSRQHGPGLASSPCGHSAFLQTGIFSMLAMPASSELPPQRHLHPQGTPGLKAQNPSPLGLLLWYQSNDFLRGLSVSPTRLSSKLLVLVIPHSTKRGQLLSETAT